MISCLASLQQLMSFRYSWTYCMHLVFIWHEVSSLWCNVVVSMMSWKYQMYCFSY